MRIDVFRLVEFGVLREPRKGVISYKGTMLQSAGGDAPQVAPVRWVPFGR